MYAGVGSELLDRPLDA
ncbi:hypothetical protein ACLK19_06790 [Escherichia coli]